MMSTKHKHSEAATIITTVAPVPIPTSEESIGFYFHSFAMDI
jgi:hypothetical protein